MSYGILDTAKDIIQGNLELSSAETINNREMICMKCTQLRKSKFDKLGICGACGCLMSQKIKLEKASCVKEKW
jgi:hypothetical protein